MTVAWSCCSMSTLRGSPVTQEVGISTNTNVERHPSEYAWHLDEKTLDDDSQEAVKIGASAEASLTLSVGPELVVTWLENHADLVR